MFLRVFSFLLLIIFCNSCDKFSFTKKTSSSNSQGTDTILDFSSVDVSPSFKVCDSLIDKISEEMRESPKVLATGGLAKPIMEVSNKTDRITEDLTLWGLHYIYHSRIK